MPSNSRNSRENTGFLKKLRKLFSMNIGTMLFGMLFIYMAFSAILYLTSPKIESYQVIAGPLSRNETYTGLAIREESVHQAETSGYITYYAREGSKINADGVVYGISSTKTSDSQTELSADELSSIRNQMLNFSKGVNSSKFNTIVLSMNWKVISCSMQALPVIALPIRTTVPHPLSLMATRP